MTAIADAPPAFWRVWPMREGRVQCREEMAGPQKTLSSSAKADDPVFQRCRMDTDRPQRTGCPACAGHDGYPLRRPHPVMADAPLAAGGVAEQARGGEEEPAPAPHPQARVAAIDLAQHRF